MYYNTLKKLNTKKCSNNKYLTIIKIDNHVYSLYITNKRYVMGAFTTKKIIYGNSSQIPDVAEQIRQVFVSDGYEVRIVNPSDGQEIYITKGGFIKTAIGLRSALKITMKPTREGYIDFTAGVNIFKQQLIPTIITMFVFSPIVISQIWGIIKQAKMDEKALDIAERALYQARTI